MGITRLAATPDPMQALPTAEAEARDTGDASGVRYVGLRATPSEARSITLLGRAESLPWSDETFVVVDPTALARRLRDRVLDGADARNVAVSIYCTCDELRVAPLAFAQAIHELLDNAVRATRPGYAVVMDVRRTSSGEVIWQLQDAGDGMTSSDLARLGRSEGEGRGGHGIALAWAVVDAHGGLLHFESALGVGTTASVWLPQRVGPRRTQRA